MMKFYMSRFNKHFFAGFLLFAALCALDAREVKSSITGVFDWEKMRIDTKLSLELSSIGVRLPAGRTQAEEALFSEYFERIRPFILSIRLDSSTVIGDLIDSRQLSPSMIDTLAMSAVRQTPRFSFDLSTISTSYALDLKSVGSRLTRHEESAEMIHLVNPAPVPVYTGVIIIADGELPVHGRKSSATLMPCLFPRIWDSDMNLIYERNMTNPVLNGTFAMVRYTNAENIFKNNPSGIDDDLKKVVGEKPLRIIAQGIFGINPTDPVIDREDALTILASEANKQLLKEGRVAIIVPADALHNELKQ
jgi:hypothetical protein